MFTYTASMIIPKEKKEDFAENADKGYVSKFREMERRSVVFIAVKRKNMIKSDEEAEY